MEYTHEPVKMSFSIEELAKNSRPKENSYQKNAVIYNYNQSTSTSIYNTSGSFTSATVLSMMPMTSTAVTRPIAKHNGNHQMSQKRKLPDDPTSEDSSLSSSYSRSSECTSPSASSDDSEITNDLPAKKSRTTFTNTQVRELEIYYSNNKYLPIEERHLFVKRLTLSQHQIKWWFQNRRMKEKRQLKNMNTFGEIDMTQFVGIGKPCPSSSTSGGNHPSHQHGYINYPKKPASPVFSPVSPYMYGFGSMPYVVYPNYSKQFYNGLSPYAVHLNRQ
jgi:hypothetical protein